MKGTVIMKLESCSLKPEQVIVINGFKELAKKRDI
jgi:hypothetical protein